MTLHRIFLPFVAALLIAGCGGPSEKSVAGNRFPENDRNNFLAGCEDRGASVSACGCILAAVERRWSYDEFEAMMRRVAEGEQPSAEFMQVAAGCANPA